MIWLIRISGAVAALLAFIASVLTIVDYALNKPEVIRTTFGPLIGLFENAVQRPIAALAAGPTPSPGLLLLISTLAALGAALLLWGLLRSPWGDRFGHPATKAGMDILAVLGGAAMIVYLAHLVQ